MGARRDAGSTIVTVDALRNEEVTHMFQDTTGALETESTTAADQAAQLQAFTAPEPIHAPVVVAERPTKPRRMQVESRAIHMADGTVTLHIRAKPGNVITDVFLSNIDKDTRMCRAGIVTQPRRGRPRK